MAKEKKKMLCFRCKRELEPKRAYFRYLGHSFYTDVLRCPQCGEIFIPEDLVKGRMSEVEMELEDK